MKRHRLSKVFAVASTAFVLLFAGVALAQAPAEVAKPEAKPAAKRPATKFIRVERNDDDEPVRLQTSIVSYVPAGGEGKLVVDLVGAVHVGDKAYYDELNKRFKDYDVVLYELVAPKDRRIPRPDRERNDNPITLLQTMTKSMLDLDSQVDCIDYTKDNFVHADMSPEEMQKAMKERGEDGVTLALGVMTDMLRQANLAERKARQKPAKDADAEQVDPLALLTDPQRSLKMKRMMAESFVGEEAGGLGPTLERMLVKDRNGAAMKVFQKELAKGRKRIAIFYGAAHMPDFERRLMVDFGLKPAKTQWLTAWRMTGGNMNGGAKDPLIDLLRLLEEASRE